MMPGAFSFGPCCEILNSGGSTGLPGILASATVAVKWAHFNILQGDNPLFLNTFVTSTEITAMLSTWDLPSNHLQFVDEVEHHSPLLE